jgi:hypothetical protein
MKPHQSRVVGTIAITQQIPTGLHLTQLAIEAQVCDDFLLPGLLPVSGIGDGVGSPIDDFDDD